MIFIHFAPRPRKMDRKRIRKIQLSRLSHTNLTTDSSHAFKLFSKELGEVKRIGSLLTALELQRVSTKKTASKLFSPERMAKLQLELAPTLMRFRTLGGNWLSRNLLRVYGERLSPEAKKHIQENSHDMAEISIIFSIVGGASIFGERIAEITKRVQKNNEFISNQIGDADTSALMKLSHQFAKLVKVQILGK